MTDKKNNSFSYNASSIEVLEGLDPVRKRPGMYIGGTDNRSLHHLVSEVLDNAMDEAVAGFALHIGIELISDTKISIFDDGRGIPIDLHPKFPEKTALEVILCTLHAGGKFSNKNYSTSGGLHGVGISVVNALSSELNVEIYKNKDVYSQDFSEGIPVNKIKKSGKSKIKSGTKITFSPDKKIFSDNCCFNPEKIYELVKSKAFLYSGVIINWKIDEHLTQNHPEVPTSETFQFKNGLKDLIQANISDSYNITDDFFFGKVQFKEKFGEDNIGSVEWCAVFNSFDPFVKSYCNTIPTQEGGTHQQGFLNAILKGIKSYTEILGEKRFNIINKDDVQDIFCGSISVFIENPQFVGQTKDKLSNPDTQRKVEASLKDHFENWLAFDKERTILIIENLLVRAENRIKNRQKKETLRKTPLKKLMLPGKLADCSKSDKEGTELFLVEGDSAGGSAKQARDRNTQAILPLKGKILNVLGSSSKKLNENQEIDDLCKALGIKLGSNIDLEDIRYEKIIIMTDADVDGAHIASLLITFFYTKLIELIDNGFLYIAVPPLYKITHNNDIKYANTEIEKDAYLKTINNTNANVQISRFKGLGEMNPSQLKETTMNKLNRRLVRIETSSTLKNQTDELVKNLMGKNPEFRFNFISKNAKSIDKNIIF